MDLRKIFSRSILSGNIYYKDVVHKDEILKKNLFFSKAIVIISIFSSVMTLVGAIDPDLNIKSFIFQFINTWQNTTRSFWELIPGIKYFNIPNALKDFFTLTFFLFSIHLSSELSGSDIQEGTLLAKWMSNNINERDTFLIFFEWVITSFFFLIVLNEIWLNNGILIGIFIVLTLLFILTPLWMMLVNSNFLGIVDRIKLIRNKLRGFRKIEKDPYLEKINDKLWSQGGHFNRQIIAYLERLFKVLITFFITITFILIFWKIF